MGMNLYEKNDWKHVQIKAKLEELKLFASYFHFITPYLCELFDYNFIFEGKVAPPNRFVKSSTQILIFIIKYINIF